MTKREQIYELLWAEFRGIAQMLTAEQETELDGKLWALSQRTVETIEMTRKECADAPLDVPPDHDIEWGSAAHLRTKIRSLDCEQRENQGDVCSVCRRPVIDGRWHE